MMKVFASPSRYVQGAGVFTTELRFIKQLGRKALLITDQMVWEIVGEKLVKNLQLEDVKTVIEVFQGESSEVEIQRIGHKGASATVELIIGLGGGKVMDTAKAVANHLTLPIAILPTVASTDAATSCISVLYDEVGHFQKYRYFPKNPELVLVDTTVIAQAPVKLLVLGMADALATSLEARSIVKKSAKNLLNGYSTLAACTIAEKCEAVIFEQAAKAVSANEAHVVTEAFEQVVEANILLSGLGFESVGLAAAHAIHNGFAAADDDALRLAHGEKVAYGILVQLMLENAADEVLLRYLSLFQELGLPMTSWDVFLRNERQMRAVAQQAAIESETIHHLTMPVTADLVYASMKTLDAYVQTYFLT